MLLRKVYRSVMIKIGGIGRLMARAAFILVWLGWMGIMYHFSSKTWSGANTRSRLEVLLASNAPWLLELLSPQQLETFNFVIRKLAHFTEYGILTWLGFYAWSVGIQQPRNRALGLTLLCSAIYAIADELRQSFVPGRFTLFSDVLIDILGALATVWLIKWRTSRTRNSHPGD